MRDYRCISADSHWTAAPEKWAYRVSERFRDRLPRRISLPNGGDGFLHEDGHVTYGGTSHFAGHGPERFNPCVERYDEEVGYGSPEQRLKEQDADGVDAEVLFDFTPRYRDTEFVQAMVRAQNDWLAEEFCAVA